MTANKRGKRLNRIAQVRKERQIFALVLLLGIVLAVIGIRKWNAKAVIDIKVSDEKMRQGDKMPVYKGKVRLVKPGKHALKRVIVKTENYTVSDLIKDMEKGKSMTLTCDADGEKEGKFPIKAELSPELENAYRLKLKDKVEFRFHKGSLTVKNRYGDFKGEKFQGLDGKPVKNMFVPSKGHTYYFDDKGKMVKGDITVDNAVYHFDKKGHQVTGFLKGKKHTRYFDADGRMAVGWKTIDNKRYYFDKAGVMCTGKIKIGPKTCTFAKDGTLQKEEGGTDPNRPMIAVTFDDGPGENTLRLVNFLKEKGARCTFFMTGNALSRKDIDVDGILKAMEDAGCEPANHTMTHKALSTLTAEGVVKEVSGVNALLRSYLGYGAQLLRPPYGDGIRSEKVIDNVHLPMIYWTVDTEDWKNRNVAVTKQKILKARDGDIVLLHDIHPTSVQAAMEAIPELMDKGYQIVTVSEMAAARGVTLVDGETYFDFYKRK